MKTFIFWGSLLLSFVAHADAVHWMQLQDRHRMLEQQKLTQEFPGRDAATNSFEQKLNHNDAADMRTFKQRYWTDDGYGAQNSSPTVLFLCGEWRCSNSEFISINDISRKLKAHMVVMEHRYYGTSQPFAELTTENLKYLTTSLALEDFAKIENHIQKTRKWTGPWVVVGGSYSASLAAYYRLKYPKLARAAWASSGPVRAEDNFEEYDLHVNQTLGKQCADRVRYAFTTIEKQVGNEAGMLPYKKMFEAEALKNDVDFLYLLADTAAAAAQYGAQQSFCNYLNQTDAITGYAQYVLTMYQNWGMDALSLSVESAQDLNPDHYEHAGFRQWYYQSCTEYGYWQNAYHDPSLATRSQKINAEYHRNICKRLFNINPNGPDAINEAFYSPLLNEASQIFFSNGSNDPWSLLSISDLNGNNVNTKNVSFMIEGAAHCDDLSAGNGSASMQAAHQALFENLSHWIQ